MFVCDGPECDEIAKVWVLTDSQDQRDHWLTELGHPYLRLCPYHKQLYDVAVEHKKAVETGESPEPPMEE